MTKSTAIYQVRWTERVGSNEHRIHYFSGINRSVDVRPVETLPNGSVILQVERGEKSDEEILLIKHDGTSYLNFTDNIAEDARSAVRAAQEAAKEKISSSA